MLRLSVCTLCAFAVGVCVGLPDLARDPSAAGALLGWTAACIAGLSSLLLIPGRDRVHGRDVLSSGAILFAAFLLSFSGLADVGLFGELTDGSPASGSIAMLVVAGVLLAAACAPAIGRRLPFARNCSVGRAAVLLLVLPAPLAFASHTLLAGAAIPQEALASGRLGGGLALALLVATGICLRPGSRSSHGLSQSHHRSGLRLSVLPLAVLAALYATGFGPTSAATLPVAAILLASVTGPMAGIVRDLDADRRHETAAVDRLEIAQRVLSRRSWALERSNDDLDAFASVASHDLKEPLRKIRSLGGILRRRHAERLGDEGLDCLERIDRSTTRMERLIADLLALSRVSANPAPFSSVNLDRVLDDVIEDLGPRIEESGARIRRSSLPVIPGDESLLRQLLQNLVGNAIKFRKPDQPPSVEIHAALIGAAGADPEEHQVPVEACRLSIRDEGIGFDEAHRERIFGLFQRLHGRSEYDGTGIGLALVRRIVDVHGGAIRAHGERDRGATFTVTLPFNEPESETESEEATSFLDVPSIDRAWAFEAEQEAS